MPGYLSSDIISSSELTVFLKLRFRKIANFEEQLISADKFPSFFPRQMQATVDISPPYHPGILRQPCPQSLSCCRSFLPQAGNEVDHAIGIVVLFPLTRQ